MLSHISIGTRIALLVAASVVTLGLLGGTVTVGAVGRANDNTHEVTESVSTMAITAAETGKSAIEMIYSAAQLTDELRQLEADADRFVSSIKL